MTIKNKDIASKLEMINNAIPKLPKGYNWGSIKIGMKNKQVIGIITCIDTGHHLYCKDGIWLK